eukprot:1527688-Prymnesium_polylepis.1
MGTWVRGLSSDRPRARAARPCSTLLAAAPLRPDLSGGPPECLARPRLRGKIDDVLATGHGRGAVELPRARAAIHGWRARQPSRE